MELTSKQQKTLADLQKTGLKTSEEVIKWCKDKVILPRYTGAKNQSHTGRRKYSRKHYLGIIQFFSYGN